MKNTSSSSVRCSIVGTSFAEFFAGSDGWSFSTTPAWVPGGQPYVEQARVCVDAQARYYGYLCPYGRVRRKYCVHVNIQPLADHFADGHHRSEALLERVHLLQHR